MMRKLFLIAFLLALFYTQSFGQKDSSKASISINAGVAQPLGDYALKEYYGGGDFIGDASPGLAANVILNGQINTSHWGLCVLLGYYQNGFDSYSFLHPPNSSFNSNVHGTPYKDFNFMIGPSVKIGGKTISIGLHLLVGINVLVTPQLSYYESSWQEYYLSSSNAIGLGIDCGADIKWKITRKVWGALNFDFYQTKVTYNSNYVETPPLYNNPPYYASYPPTTSYVPISLLNITAGISYKL